VFKRDEVIHTFVKRTFRQSFLLALLLIISLWLGHNEWLRWWVLLLVVGVLGAWEHFFLTGEESY
jgi:diacylglycerol kinase